MADYWGTPFSTILYGPPNAGKTYLACSSFFDYDTGLEIANGKLITFGGEDNPALEIPESCRTLGKTSLHLTSPKLDSRKFAETFHGAMLKLMQDAENGNPLDVLVIDSITEFGLLFEHTSKEEGFTKWGELLAKLFSTVSLLNHKVMKCPIILTARVGEKQNAGSALTESDFMDFDYYPLLRGGFKLSLPYYSSMCLYLETKSMLATDGPYKGKRVPKHLATMLKGGPYFIKNQWEHKWMQKGLPMQLENPTWPMLMSILTKLGRPMTSPPAAVEPTDEEES